MVTIGIIIGTTRPNRFGPQVGNWAYQVAQQREDATYKLIDIEDQHLPLLDEPIPPSQNKYQNEHTKKWSAKIEPIDGFVFVTGEYNHGIPASLKNAIDYLFHEWHYKPASIVSYGSAAGGARAAEHLRNVMGEIKVYDLREQLLINSYWNRLNDKGQYKFSQEEAQTLNGQLDDLVYWASVMQAGRDHAAEGLAALRRENGKFDLAEALAR